MHNSLENIIIKLHQIHQGEKIVFTNGVFDIIHRGHVDYLQKARDEGDILVVGLNSDESVKRLKGPKRPINCEEDRVFVLLGLKAVDYVFIFSEDTPLSPIIKIAPDVLVKGGDYDADETDQNSPKYIVGSKEVATKGGKTITISFVEGKSTTGIINRIENS